MRKTWQVQFDKAEGEYQKLLEELDTEDIGYKELNAELLGLKTREQELTAKRNEVNNVIRPRLHELAARREELLTELQKQRNAVREMRIKKAAEVTQALDDRVRVEVKPDAESTEFRNLLLQIRVTSRIREDRISEMAENAHPIPFVKSLIAGEYEKLGKITGVESRDFERLHTLVIDENRLADLYELQIVDVEDRIDVSLQVGDGVYKDLKQLAHGEKCTAVLSIAMAEGKSPVISDQPEDALHAQFIVEHVVTTLRKRRGVRQYIFATRNANILVSGDAEQAFVLSSDGEHGGVESSGSIDRLSTRQSVLLNLEGGVEAFARRSLRYGVGGN